MFNVFALIYNKTTLMGHIPNKAVYNLVQSYLKNHVPYNNVLVA